MHGKHEAQEQCAQARSTATVAAERWSSARDRTESARKEVLALRAQRDSIQSALESELQRLGKLQHEEQAAEVSLHHEIEQPRTRELREELEKFPRPAQVDARFDAPLDRRF